MSESRTYVINAVARTAAYAIVGIAITSLVLAIPVAVIVIIWRLS